MSIRRAYGVPSNNGRVVVGCTHGDQDPDYVAVAYLTAVAALDQGKDDGGELVDGAELQTLDRRLLPGADAVGLLMEFDGDGATTFNY